MARGRVFLITTDKQLANEIAPSMTGREYDLVVFPTVRDASIRIGTEDVAGIVADITRIAPGERLQLAQIQGQKGFPLFLLDTVATISPAENNALRRLTLPFPAGFTDQVRAVDRPIVFLVDQALFASRGLQVTFQQCGIATETVDKLENITPALHGRLAPKTTPPPAAPTTSSKPVSFWEKLTTGGGKLETPDQSAASPAPGGKRVVVALFAGSDAQADQLDQKLRGETPNVCCYQVSSQDLARAAGHSVRQGTPVGVMRDQANKISQILAESVQAAAAAPQQRGKERVLVLDNDKTVMEVLAQTLTAAGYDVTATQDPEQALKLATAKGTYHLAALGIALNYAKITARDLAQKLRDADPDLRMIFMIDRVDPSATLKNIGDVVALGVDAALIKPVQPTQVLFFAQRALEQRFLKFENERLLTEVQESARKLAQVNGFQTKFFATVAHDVKNPLTAILGYSEVLSMRLKELPNELKCASHIHSAAKTLNLLISDLVDLAAIESGKLRVQLGPLDLHAVLNDVRSRIEVVATQRNMNFAIECPQQLPPMQGDGARLGQVIQNLCTNAIQYTKEGGKVTVGVDVTADWVTVGVRDTGIGIKKEDLPRVFERFFQTAEAQQMRKAGFGLGLKISREIVQMHGGDIGVESEFGVGSRFFFTIPVQKAGGAAAPNPAAPPVAAPQPQPAK